MAAINFPDSPSNGDTHVVGGVTYTYNSAETKWKTTINSNAFLPLSGGTVTSDLTLQGNLHVDTTAAIELPAGTGAQRPATGVAGMIRYNSDTGEPEYYSGTETEWYRFRSGPPIDVDYLVIAGGGGGGGLSSTIGGGGGGAGGYRTSFGTGNISGGLSAVETAFEADLATEYTITVGAGGANDVNGSNSVFGTITSTGGGAGARWDGDTGSNGGSGGGGTGVSGSSGGNTAGGSGTANQGFDGGTGRHQAGSWVLGGGGGGAGEAGSDFVSSPASGGAGGDGIASSITGTSVTRGGGGGGGAHANGTGGAGGTGGGGAGGTLSSTNAVAGTANTGGGGGGNGNSVAAGAAGGSGVVILRVPDSVTATFSSGVTSSLSTAVTGFNIYTVTATTTTSETVTFS